MSSDRRLRDSIVTPHLRGRRITAADLPYVIDTDSDPQIQLPIFGKTFSEQESRERLGRWLAIEADQGLGFFIFGDGTDDVGHGGVFPSYTTPRQYEVGYALKPAFWGRGYATEITRALLDAAFQDTAIDRIIGVCSPANTASRRVLEKAGLSFETEVDLERWGKSVRYAVAREAWNRRNSA